MPDASSTGGRPIPPPPPPSSYQQILENMRYLNKEVYPIILALQNTAFGTDESKTDVVYSEEDESLRVKGIRMVRDAMDDPTPPRGYVRDFTVELKSTQALGLDETRGFSSPYLALFTQAASDDSDICLPWQIAIGNEFGAIYFRPATDMDTWGNWVSITSRQLVQSPTEPKDQTEGDYWLRPIAQIGELFFQPIDRPQETEVWNEYSATDFPFMNLDGSIADFDYRDLTFVEVTGEHTLEPGHIPTSEFAFFNLDGTPSDVTADELEYIDTDSETGPGSSGVGV